MNIEINVKNLTDLGYAELVEAWADEHTVEFGVMKINSLVIQTVFDEDEGFYEEAILPGTYLYKVTDFNGWRPHQLLIDGVWVDFPEISRNSTDKLIVMYQK